MVENSDLYFSIKLILQASYILKTISPEISDSLLELSNVLSILLQEKYSDPDVDKYTRLLQDDEFEKDVDNYVKLLENETGLAERSPDEIFADIYLCDEERSQDILQENKPIQSPDIRQLVPEEIVSSLEEIRSKVLDKLKEEIQENEKRE